MARKDEPKQEQKACQGTRRIHTLLHSCSCCGYIIKNKGDP